jgi:pimeloyl-ACP methyl ester carboxylesterase
MASFVAELKRRNVVKVAVAYAIVAWSSGYAQEPQEPQDISIALDTMGVMFVGGSNTVVPYPCTNPASEVCKHPGTVRLGHAPVYYFIPSERAHSLPIVMVPGLGLPAAIYLGTPDGREGWAQFFVRRGFSVYVTTQPNAVASGLNVSPINAVKLGEADPSTLPDLLTWTPETFWRLFGYGPQYPDLWPDTQFSMSSLEGLISGISPADFSLNAEFSLNDMEHRVAAVVALLDQIGPAILITHSQSGPSGFEVARLRPDLVKAIASIEPVGCPTEEADIRENFIHIPVLTIFGDHLDSRPPLIESSDGCSQAAKLIREVGGRGEHWLLGEDLEIKGNTHMMMGDVNSDEIAEVLRGWMIENGL